MSESSAVKVAYNSNWIDHNYYLRPVAGSRPEERRYERYGRPRIVCLCGSTKFFREFQDANLKKTLAGEIVLSIGAARCADGDDKKFGGYVPESEWDAQKVALDVLHKEKISLADYVFVLNVGGYVGESTRSEVLDAKRKGKFVEWLEPDKIPEDLK